MQKITVHTGRPYDILIDDGLLEQAGDLVRRVSGAKRICLISDSNVYPLYGDRGGAGAGERRFSGVHPGI